MITSRRLLLTVALLAAAVAMGGCASTHTAEKDAAVVGTDLQAKVAALPGVTDAKVWTTGYRDVASAEPYAVNADVTTASGTDTVPIADEIVKLVWLSSLQPGPQVSVTFFDERGYLPGKAVAVSLDRRSLDSVAKQLQADLEKRYGPRPSGSR